MRLSAYFAALLLLLTACATAPPYTTNIPTNLATQADIPSLPFFPQLAYQCGPAALATVLNANGVAVSPESLREEIYIPEKRGAVTTEVIARARRYGMFAYPLTPKLSSLLTEIDAGNPVLVLQNLGYTFMPRWHFSVVQSYHLKEQSINLRSGTERNHWIPFSLFYKTWKRADFWAFTITKPTHLPATAVLEKSLATASDLERTGNVNAALNAYNSIISRWPESTLPTFGAANSAYAMGDYEQAAKHYTRYINTTPMRANGWNNLAYNLIQQGCPSEATEAVACAAKLAPTNNNIADSVREVESYVTKRSATSNQRHCEIPQCPV